MSATTPSGIALPPPRFDDPAVFELLGRATWAFPRALDRLLPRLAIEPPD